MKTYTKNLLFVLTMGMLATIAQAQKIVLTGDSTVATYSSGEKQGWGRYLSKYLVSGARVVNWARGGYSTKTFLSDGLWRRALNEKGAYVFIQFGHNDQGKRHTVANTTYKSNLRRMIKDVKAYGGLPVIVSSPRRLKFTSKTQMTTELTPYAIAAREVADEADVPFIDLHKLTRDTYVRLGETKAKAYFAKGDTTHTNAKGADLLASLVAEEMDRDPDLKELLD